MTECNGWSNWETWSCDYHYDFLFRQLAKECYKQNYEEAINILIDKINSMLTELAETHLTSLADSNEDLPDFISAGIHKININEIAQRYINQLRA